MAKKLLLLLISLLIFTGTVFTQEPQKAKNAIMVSFGVIGAELSYERMFNRHLSVLADVSYTTLIFVDEFTASGKGRWYPFGKAFYLDLGLGFSYGKGMIGFMGDMILSVLTFGYYLTVKNFENDEFRTGGFLIQGCMGWKIDIGKQDRIVLPISMGVDFRISGVPDFLPYIRIGLGYAF